MGKVYKGKVGFVADITGAMNRVAQEKIRQLQEQENAGKLGKAEHIDNRNRDDNARRDA